MKSLFNKEDGQFFIERISTLKADAKPLWGRMNAAQMLAHCAAPLRMAHGEIKGKRGLISYLFGKQAKKKFLSPSTIFPKNLPTDKNFIFSDTIDFAEKQKSLIAKIQEFAEKGPSAIAKGPHSFFGNLTPAEWDIIQVKHLEHHLTQFGV
jgi:hypothetical protein